MWTNHIFRWGTGCGIEIRGANLHVVALKSRPAGVSVLGSTVLRNFRERPPHEWGAEYAAFLAGHALTHLAATVSLPRNEVIVRQISLPPVSRKEIAAAVAYQLDTLHPFGEDDVCYAFSPLVEKAEGKGQLPVSIVIAERTTVDAYADLFESAGIAVQAFTVTAAAFYTGLRVRWDSPPAPFVVADLRGPKLELYGECSSRKTFSAEFDIRSMPSSRALQLAGAELRLEQGAAAPLIVCGGEEPEDESLPVAALEEPESAGFERRPAAEFLPVPLTAPSDFDVARDGAVMAVALEAACPRMGWRTNLLPVERRQASSRWLYAPTAALAVALVILALAFVSRPVIQDRNYIRALEAETARFSQLATQVNETKAESDEAKRRAALLQAYEERTVVDLRILSELSTLIPDTVWLNNLDLDDKGVRIAGESASAAPLLGLLNESQLLANATFVTSLLKTENGERFQIAAERRTIPTTHQPAAQPTAQTPAPAPPQATPATLSTVGTDAPPSGGAQ
jgi:Tfp pilus assembly protein PilN